MPAGLKTAEAIAKLLKNEAITVPTKLYIGLCEVEPKKNWTAASALEELTYEGYARVEITLAEEELVVATESVAEKILNKAAIILKANTNTTGKNKAKYWFLADSASGAGGIWFYGSLTEEVVIVKAMTEVKVPAKELSVGVE